MKTLPTLFGAVALVIVCALAAPPNAHSLPPEKRAPRAGASAASKPGASVQGVVSSSTNSPVPGVRLQLRNLITGKVDATTVANQTGQFTFTQVNGGRYVVEMVGANGKIATVGQGFAVSPGQSVATFVRMGPKVPFVPGFFQNAASAVASSAASQGITAIAPVQLTESR